ncbi:MAG: signal peptidase I [Candidatus Izemoplasmatales bacterium]
MKTNDNPSKKPIDPRILGWIRFLVAVALVLGLGYVLFNRVPYFSRMRHYVIVTGSMEPVISVGDVVVVDRSVDLADLEVGDVIAFRVEVGGNEAVVVHYVAAVQVDGEGVRTFRTKPEVSDEWDDWTLSEDDVVGRLLFIVPVVGRALLFLESPVGKIVVVADIAILSLLFDSLSKKKRKAKA